MEILIELGAFCKINLNDKCLTKKKKWNYFIAHLQIRRDRILSATKEQRSQFSCVKIISRAFI